MSTKQPIKPLKILISAYACRPNLGSEPGVGWNTVQELANYHQVWVLTRQDNQPDIESYQQNHATSGLNFVYCRPPRWARWWQPTQIPHYYFWQIGAYKVGRQLHQVVNFDVIHHVTYVRYSTPSFLVQLPCPFVWGPVGGGEMAPKTFWHGFSLRGKIYEFLRRSLHSIGEQDPNARLTAKTSALVFATTEDTAKRLRHMGAQKVQILSALGLSQPEIDNLAQYKVNLDAPVKFISIGRLLHWKGFHLGVRAFAEANLPTAEYWIVGDGPEQPRLRSLAQEVGVAKQVKFLGLLPRHQTLNKLSQCHVLVHPSLHDSGGGVCIEAMAAGRPVICLELGGPGIHVSEDTGIKVPAVNPEQSITGLANAMTVMVNNPQQRIQMGRAGRERARKQFSWTAKGQHLARLYSKIVAEQGSMQKV